MEQRDQVELYCDTLLVHFARSGTHGNVALLPLADGAAISREDRTLRVRTRGSAGTFILESFSSAAMAKSAHGQLQAAMQRYARGNMWRRRRRASAIWLACPLLALALLGMLNAALVGGPPSLAASHAARYQGAPQTPAPAAVAEASTGAMPAAADLGRALADGARTGRFSVMLSHGKKGVLYIFSDPSCPHCQRLEPELRALERDFTIHLFPVSVIGKEASRIAIIKAMCAGASERPARWRKLAAGEAVPGESCAAGELAVDGNDQVFAAMKLAGTPAILSGSGAPLPDAVPATADGIRRWLDQTVSLVH